MSLRTNIRNSPADPSADLVGAYDQQTFPRFRIATLDTLEWGRKRHHIPLMLEVDVTAAREAIRRQKEQTGESVLFDHDVTDGAPVARFVGRLQELMESAYAIGS